MDGEWREDEGDRERKERAQSSLQAVTCDGGVRGGPWAYRRRLPNRSARGEWIGGRM